jgi:hypothetical protein
MLKFKTESKWVPIMWAGVVMATAAGPSFAAETPSSKGFQGGRYLNWDALTIESEEAETKLVTVPGIGGRIMRYEVMGENILWDNPVTYGLTAEMTKRALLPGGYQMYVVSETTSLGTPARLEYGPYTVAAMRDYSVMLASETDLLSGLRLEKEIVLDPERGEVGILQRAKNLSGKRVSCGIRARTQCKSGGFVLVPLNKFSRFRAGWALRHDVEGKGVYDSLNPASPQVKILGNILVLEAKGAEMRIGADSDAEWIAYVCDRSMLVQYFPYDFRAKYPNGGHTVEVAWNDLWTELELLGPETAVAGGAEKTMAVKWVQIPLNDPVRTAKQARALANKVPPSPFKTSKP